MFVAAALPASVVVGFGATQVAVQGEDAWATIVLTVLMLVVMGTAWWFARVVGTSVTADLRRLHAVSTIVGRGSGGDPLAALRNVRTTYVESESIMQAMSALVSRADSTRAQNGELAAYVAHDMRTPLAALAMSIGQITAPTKDDAVWIDEQRAEIGRILRDLDLLVEALRGRSDRGDGSPGVREPVVSVASLVDAVARRVVPGGQRAPTVVVHRDFAIDADEPMLVRLIENLVSNALRHGAGDVVAEVGNGYLRVLNEVTTDAIGEKATVDQPATHGLGHMIVRRWVESIGGKVVVQAKEGWYSVDVFLPVNERAKSSRGTHAHSSR